MSRFKYLLMTAAATGVVLFQPGSAAAQAGLPDCGPGAGVPCVLDGETVTPRMVRRLPSCEAGDGSAFPCVSAARDVIANAEQAAELDGAAAEAEGGTAEETAAPAEAAEDLSAESPTARGGEADATPGSEEQAAGGATTAEDGAEAETAQPVAEEAATETPRERRTETETADAPESAPETAGAAESPAEAAETGASDRSTLRAAREAARGETAAAAAADTESRQANVEVEVEETTVTEGETRRASQEFDRSVASGTETAAAPKAQEDDGLSTFEKALLVGLGAIAVGELLDNGDRIVSNTGDRVVVQRGDEFRVLKDDDTLLRQPGSEVRTERFSDGSTRETLIQPDGRKIVTIRAADGRVLRRVRVLEDGTQVVLFDDTQTYAPVDVTELPPPATQTISLRDIGDEAALRAAIEAELARDLGRSFSLAQVREIRAVRELVPTIEVEAITFALGSAAIRPEQARELADLGLALREMIDARPGEVFLVEGHTDATGSAALNLALSDRRAETVALALTEFFEVPPENLVVQGYGESALKIETEAAEEANRRVVVRRITPLLGERRIAKDF